MCCAGSRLLVQESIAALVLRKLRRRIQLLRVGDPLDKNTDVGSISSLPQLRKIERLVELGVQQGAELYQSDCTLPSRAIPVAPTG